MNDFNPFSAQLASRRGNNIAERLSNEYTSFGLDLLPPRKSIEAATDHRLNGTVNMEGSQLDDFDRQLLAQSHSKKESVRAKDSLSTVEDPGFHRGLQYGASDTGTNECKSNRGSRLISTVHQENNLGSSTSASSDVAPFSSPTVAFQNKRQELLGRRNNLGVRNAFHGRLEQVRREGVRNTSESEQTAKPPVSRTNRVERPLIRGIELVPATSLPDKQRSVFKFPIFNAVQSRCFPTAYESDNNLVVSAPTGSGKTAIMELGILRLIESLKSGRAKVVYQAPTKSLCSERYRDWQTKFGVFDIQCAELTGDTEQSHLRNVANASIIITTPEKWDSVTRKWKDNAKLMNMIKLFLVDEVHILKDKRGATLEAIVSRMKAVGNSIRFIALSATIPNSEDIAVWLTRNEQARHLPAVREVFDDSFRPVQLKKHILGHEGPYNPWAFDAALTEKIPDVVSRYGKRKPVMVFCPTKESAQRTASRLTQSWLDSTGGKRAWDAPRSIAKVENENLQKMLPTAVAFHHASLSLEDRKAVEQGFLNGDINIICSTSTLAVGVNLPCYLVILKGTQGYADNGLQEYSSLEVMQMLGRAGRPQYETEACAIILCLNDRLSKYEKMVVGEEVLESSLHQNLIEHLNAEIGLGTVDSMTSAKKWLSSTFLHVRLQKNPQYYNLDPKSHYPTPDAGLLHWCEKDIDLLTETHLVNNNGTLRATEYGDIMARYCIRFETMKIFMAVSAQAKFSEILSALCQAVEFREFRMRQGDKTFYKELNQASEIRFPINVDIALPQHKVSLIIQTKLGCVPVGKDREAKNKSSGGQLRQLGLDTNGVINHAKRLIRCMVDIFVQRNDSVTVKGALELARGLAAGVWDNTVMQLKQVPGIGDVFMRKLAAAGIKDIDTLFNTEPHRIEVILSKNPPFGLELIKKVADFPMLHISVRECGQKQRPGKGVDVKLRCEVGFLNEQTPLRFNRRPFNILFLCETSYGAIIDFRRFGPGRLKTAEEILLTSTIEQFGAKLRCHIMCDDIAGTHRFAELDIDCPASWFPPQPPVPETSFQRPRVQPEASTRPASEEFDNDGVDDSNLLAAISKSAIEQIVEDIDDIMTEVDQKKHTRKRSLTVSSGEEREGFREPRRLANGNWTCQHACKDEGKECKHKCCVEGVKKRPKNKKQKKDKAAVPSDAGRCFKSGKKDTKKESANGGPLDKMLQRTDNDGIKGVTQKSRAQPAAGPGLPPKRATSQTYSNVPSRTTDVNTPVSHDCPDPEQISDVLDFGDFDWQAMDEIAAAFDFDSVVGETAAGKVGQNEGKIRDEARGLQLRGLDLSKPTVFDQSSDYNALFFAHTSSPYEQAVSRHGSCNTNDLGNNGANTILHKNGSSTEPTGADAMYSTARPHIERSFSSSTTKILSPQMVEAETGTCLNEIEETEYECGQQLEEEAQKTKWAELDSDFLTYETFGKYIRIVED